MMNRIASAIEARRYRYLNQRTRDIVCPGGVVSFTFDDFPESAAVGAELLEQRAWRGTFYLSTGNVGKETDFGPIASFDLANKLHTAGHEIGDHTHTHIRCRKAKKSVLRRELDNSAAILRPAYGGRNFALPYGDYDSAALNVLSGRFDTIRTTTQGINAQRKDLNTLKANPIYGSTDLEAVAALLDETRTNNGWLIFYTHDVRARHSQHGCTPQQFDAVLALVAARGLPVKTVSGVYASL